MSATRNPWAAVQRLIDRALASYCPHRVGELYISMTDADPSKTWPGTEWEQITDAMIRAADADHPAGSTGGSWTHMQSSNEVADHFHYYGIDTTIGNPQIEFDAWAWFIDSSVIKQHETDETKLGAEIRMAKRTVQPMDITNKYIAVYMWRRTA